MGPHSLDYLSVCTGGGGLDLALDLAVPGARPVALVEGEAFAISCLVEAMAEGRLAAAPVWSNARTFPGRRFRGCLDGVIGGIPCQPHSDAGRKRGADDDRDLWSTTRRLIVQTGAWFLWLENVPGMLSSGGAARVYGDLHRLGFEVEGGLFTTSEVGGSQERERLFILAVASTRGPDAKRWGRAGDLAGQGGPAEGQGDQWQRGRDAAGHPGEALGGGHRLGRWAEGDHGVHPAPVPYPGRADVAGAHGGLRGGRPGEPGGQSTGGAPAGWAGPGRLFPPYPDDLDGWAAELQHSPHLEPAVCRMADGLASRVDKLRMLGNGVVPLAGAYAFRTLASDLARRSPSAAFLVRMMDQAD